MPTSQRFSASFHEVDKKQRFLKRKREQDIFITCSVLQLINNAKNEKKTNADAGNWIWEDYKKET